MSDSSGRVAVTEVEIPLERLEAWDRMWGEFRSEGAEEWKPSTIEVIVCSPTTK